MAGEGGSEKKLKVGEDGGSKTQLTTPSFTGTAISYTHHTLQYFVGMYMTNIFISLNYIDT